MKMSEIELTEESRKAAEWYMKKNFPDYATWGIEEKTRVFNVAAHNFFMGVRWLENKLMGATLTKSETNKQEKGYPA